MFGKKKRRRTTAEDFMRELEADPSFVADRERREREAELNRTRSRAAQQPILERLAKLGIEIDSLTELAEQPASLSPSACEVLLASLAEVEDDGVRELIVRVLAASPHPIAGDPLVRAFEGARGPSLRWAIANTLAEAKPRGIAEWLLRALADETSGDARQMLALAVARHVDARRALPALRDSLSVIPGHAAMALGEVGGDAEVALLTEQLSRVEGWERREFERAIERIRRRG